MSNSHSGKFSKTGGKCPNGILANFQKREENVHQSFLQICKNRREMPYSYFGKFSKIGGKCSIVILANFENGGKCVKVILNIFQKQEETVLW